MTGESGSDRASRPEEVEDLREQVSRDRRELAETVSALHDKADIKERVKETATGAESAVAALLSRAVRTVGTLPALVRRATSAASERAHRRV
jgi:hypothetical protein